MRLWRVLVGSPGWGPERWAGAGSVASCRLLPGPPCERSAAGVFLLLDIVSDPAGSLDFSYSPRCYLGVLVCRCCGAGARRRQKLHRTQVPHPSHFAALCCSGPRAGLVASPFSTSRSPFGGCFPERLVGLPGSADMGAPVGRSAFSVGFQQMEHRAAMLREFPFYD